MARFNFAPGGKLKVMQPFYKTKRLLYESILKKENLIELVKILLKRCNLFKQLDVYYVN